MWFEESIQWVLLDFQAGVEPNSVADYRVENRVDAEREVLPCTISIQQASSSIRIDTGVATFLYTKWMVEHEVHYKQVLDPVEIPMETRPAQGIRKGNIFMFGAWLMGICEPIFKIFKMKLLLSPRENMISSNHSFLLRNSPNFIG